jgi:hypothetical protein
MPSADFCLITTGVSAPGAWGFRGDRAHPSHPTHVRQISPDKNVNCPCTTAVFTLSPEPEGFVMSCQLAPETGPSYTVSVRRSARPAIGLPSDHSSRNRPCRRLVLLVASLSGGCPWFSYRGLSPHKFTPMPGVHDCVQPIADKAGSG